MLDYNNYGGILSAAGNLTGFALAGLQGSQNLSLTNANQLPLELDVGMPGQTTTYSGVLSGTGRLGKYGAGTLTLSGANTFTGLTGILGGTVLLANPNALQASTLDYEHAGTLSFGCAHQRDLRRHPRKRKPRADQRQFRGRGSLGRRATDNPPCITASCLCRLAEQSRHRHPGLAPSGFVSGFTGNTTVSGGVLELGNAWAIQNSTLDYSNYGGTVYLGAPICYLGGLEGSQNLALQAGSPNFPVTLVVGQNNQSTTYSGVLSGPGQLGKGGPAR